MFSEEPLKVDSVLISNKGVLVIHISQKYLVDFMAVQDNLYNKIEVKLKTFNFFYDAEGIYYLI